jgi:hypothetical protein
MSANVAEDSGRDQPSADEYAPLHTENASVVYARLHNDPAYPHRVPASEDRYDEAIAENIRREMRDFVASRGGQVKAGEIFRTHQTTVGRRMNGPHQPTLKDLLVLRAHTGKTAEAILDGEHAATPPTSVLLAEMRALDERERRIVLCLVKSLHEEEKHRRKPGSYTRKRR